MLSVNRKGIPSRYADKMMVEIRLHILFSPFDCSPFYSFGLRGLFFVHCFEHVSSYENFVRSIAQIDIAAITHGVVYGPSTIRPSCAYAKIANRNSHATAFLQIRNDVCESVAFAFKLR